MPSLKNADPTANVISAGLAGYGAYNGADATHMNPINFLQQMYANGAVARHAHGPLIDVRPLCISPKGHRNGDSASVSQRKGVAIAERPLMQIKYSCPQNHGDRRSERLRDKSLA